MSSNLLGFFFLLGADLLVATHVSQFFFVYIFSISACLKDDSIDVGFWADLFLFLALEGELAFYLGFYYFRCIRSLYRLVSPLNRHTLWDGIKLLCLFIL